MLWNKKPRFDIESTLNSLASRLDKIEASISNITLMEKKIMSAETDLAAAVAALQVNAKAATDAIAAELAKLAAAAPDDTAAIEAAVAQITAVNKGLADAVATVTPVAPPAAPAV